MISKGGKPQACPLVFLIFRKLWIFWLFRLFWFPLTIPILHPCLIHSLLYSPFGNKALLHGYEQLVQHIHSLMNKRDAQITNLFIIHFLKHKDIVGSYVVTLGITAHFIVTRMGGTPLFKFSHTQIILIIVEQFLQTGFCHIREFYLSFTRCCCRLVSFSNILFAWARSLHHLIDGTVTFLQIMLSEIEGYVVYYLGYLIHSKVAIMPMMRKKRLWRVLIVVLHWLWI